MSELFIDPIALIFLLALVVTCLSLFIRGGGFLRRMVQLSGIALIALLLLAAAPSIVNPLLEHTEGLVDSPDSCKGVDSPLVVLSGGVSSAVQSADDLSKVYEATFVRMVEAISVLQKQAASTPVYLLGGSQRNGVAEADVMRTFFVLAGIDEDRLILERESVNTAASAVALATLMGVNESEKQPIRLLTSALHMARSKAVFSSNGFEVCPIAVDRRAVKNVAWFRLVPQSTALRKFDDLLHEWVGMVYYRVKGYF